MSKLNATVARAEAIIALAKEQRDNDIINIADLPHQCHPDVVEENVSEGDDNGAWVKAWVWVDFEDTMFDKTEDGEQPDDD